MSRERDIERVLDAWLRPGPTVMPDRLFDAVMEEVERRPQRLLPRIRRGIAALRLGMLLAAAAAIVAAVGIGAALLGPPIGPGAGGPRPAPSFAAAPGKEVSRGPASELPAALRYRWIGVPRAVEGIASAPVLPILWVADEVRFSWDAGLLYLGSTARGQGAHELTFTLADTRIGGCAAGDSGTYDWSLSADGLRLTLTSKGDACPARAAAFSGTWLRSACLISSEICLGDIPAGSYVSTFFDARSSPGAVEDKGAYGQLRYTVPAGWSNLVDSPTGYSLVPTADAGSRARDGGPARAVALVARPAARENDADCSVRPASGVADTPEGLAAWVAGRPGIVATRPAKVTIGGRPGTMVDISTRDGWMPSCLDGSPQVPLLADASSGPGDCAVGIDVGERMRLIFIDIGGGNTVAIAIDDSSAPSRFDDLVARAMPVVESFEFPQ
jgi:hypothetical protein